MSSTPLRDAVTAPLPIAELTGIFRLLADETRLRILALLRGNELAVGELQKILGAGQSTLSTQLGALKEAALVASRKEGQKVFYRIPDTEEGRSRRDLVDQALAHLGSAKWLERDQRGLHKVLESRAESSRAFFNAQAMQNLPSPGQTSKALAQGMARLLRGECIVDLGCGSGRLALLLAEAGNAVTGIDNSEEQIKLARQNAASHPGLGGSQPKKDAERSPSTLHFLQAPMEATGLPGEAFTLAVLSQSLHHAAKPELAIREAARLLAPGGRLLVLDLLAHEEEWMRAKFGDFWLGFTQESLRAWIESSGLAVRHGEITAAGREYPEIEGLLFIAEKPERPEKPQKPNHK